MDEKGESVDTGQADLTALSRELGPDLEFLGVLGEGSVATVYLARENRLDRLVAVKILSGDLSDDAVAMARFEREAKAAASLEHPNAVTVYRSGILSNHVPFQVMQYVKGRTLEDHLSGEGPLPEEEARRILASIAGALAAAHRRGFVHRDLRPGNVLCDETEDRVLVSDFGLAGILPHARSSDERITRAGEVLSDFRYASPELLEGRDLTEGTDIYALGILGYEILTGEGPYQARTQRETAMAHLRGSPRPLSSLRPDLSPELGQLLQRCLAKDPGKRPSAASVARALQPSTSLPARDAAVGRGQEPSGLLESILRRKLPQVVVVTAGAGYALSEVVGNWADLGFLPSRAYPFAWFTAICGVGAAGIIAWFHGLKGKQRVSALEILLLAIVAVIWALAGVLFFTA